MADDFDYRDTVSKLIGLVGQGSALARPILPPTMPGMMTPPPPAIPMTRGYQVAKIGNTEIRYSSRGPDAYGQPGPVEIHGVFTPKEMRGQGSARQAMQQFVTEADKNSLRVALSVEPKEYGISRSRLESLYRSLGFVPNTGRNKDFSTTSSWIRPPSAK